MEHAHLPVPALACEKREGNRRQEQHPRSPHDRTSAGAPRRHRHPRPEVAGAAGPPCRRGRAGSGLRAARVHRARGRRDHRGRRRQPSDRLRLRHRGHLGRRLRRGRRTPGLRPARRLHPHLFHGHALRGVRGGRRGPRRADPGRPRQEVRAVQLGRRGRRERRQDRPRLHQAAGGRRLRPRLPRPYQPDDGADREEHAVQARLRPVRARGLPGPGGLRLPLADRPGERGPGGRRPGHRPDHQAGRPGQRGRDHHRAGARRGRLHRAA